MTTAMTPTDLSQKLSVTIEDYDRAQELWPIELMRRAKNINVVPTWIEGENRFWYVEQSPSGHEYLLVDAATGVKRAAFDHALVARMLDADINELPIATFTYEGSPDEPAALVLTIEKSGDVVRIDLADETATVTARVFPQEFEGPDGRRVFVSEFNLWVRDIDGSERQLTQDGERYMVWATSSDGDANGVKRTVHGGAAPTFGTFWAPDGRRILTHRLDEREVEPFNYLQTVPHDTFRPRPHSVHAIVVGEPVRPIREWFVIDVETGEQIQVNVPIDELELRGSAAWWSLDSTTIYSAVTNNEAQVAGIVSIDAATGVTSVIHTESDTIWDFNTTSSKADNVRLLAERNEMLWYSNDDGWGHLYAISLDGSAAPRQLTAGEWVVADIITVTDKHLFFTATGREPEAPTLYYRHLYRIDLDGVQNAGLVRLTPELDVDHSIDGPARHSFYQWGAKPEELHASMAPSGEYFVDSVSRVDLPPVVNLRDGEGNLITELTRADVSLLDEINYRAPEIFHGKSAGEAFDISGVILRPRGHDDSTSLPVLERIYGGPQTLAQPRTYLEGLNGHFMFGLHSLAELGFVVVVLDGSGTPNRSRKIRDAQWDTADRWGVRHHRAAIESAAAERPWMDITTVGISGHSYGGYGTTMALLLEPEFYKVGFSTAGMYDPAWAYHWVVERHFGRPDYGNGRTTKMHDTEVAPNYMPPAATTHIDNLVGRLSLMFGDLDESGISPADTWRFVDALTDAGKSFDLIFLPGRDHHHTTEPYHQKRLWDYFIEHVQKREPLRHHKLHVVQGVRMGSQ